MSLGILLIMRAALWRHTGCKGQTICIKIMTVGPVFVVLIIHGQPQDDRNLNKYGMMHYKPWHFMSSLHFYGTLLFIAYIHTILNDIFIKSKAPEFVGHSKSDNFNASKISCHNNCFIILLHLVN